MPAVRLEPWGRDDFELVQQLMGDPAMTEFLGGPESLEKLADRQRRYAEPGSGMFKIVDEASGQGIGSVGFWEVDRRGETIYETGWSVVPAFQGRGIGGGDAPGHRARPRARTAPLDARIPEDREPGVERDLP